ncbi:MAG: hypothetical protein ACI4V3_09485 [Faecousia sp.]
MEYVLVLLALAVGEIVVYCIGAKTSNGSKNKGKLALASFDLAVGVFLFGISHIEIMYCDRHTDTDWYYFLFYIGLIFAVAGLVGVIFSFYEILRDRDNAMATSAAAMPARPVNYNNTGASAAYARGDTQMYAATAVQQPVMQQPVMPPEANGNTVSEKVRPVADSGNPYIITCPVCHTRQNSNRTVCFECGAEFDM